MCLVCTAVRIDASPGDGVALREVFKGVNAGAWSLHDLGWAATDLPSAGAGVPQARIAGDSLGPVLRQDAKVTSDGGKH